MSLWVVLMVPVSAFAAVVAMAGPQRLAAESSVQEAADDMAMLAVAWRAGHDSREGPLPEFPPDCLLSDEQQSDLQALQDGIEAEEQKPQQDQNPELIARLEADETELREEIERWKDSCDFAFTLIARDLGNLGVDVGSLRGFYSDSLLAGTSPDAAPCKISKRVVVRDAVHVALVADWQDAGWAAAQVWPDGRRVGAESIGRRARAVSDSDLDDCEQRLDVLDSQGQAVALTGLSSRSRELVQLTKRTAFSG